MAYYLVSLSVSVAVLLLIGFLQLRKRVQRTIERQRFATEYIGKFNEWVARPEDIGHDQSLYTWLTHRSYKMQDEMGDFGVLAGYRPAYRNQVIQNYPVIIAGLSEIVDRDRAEMRVGTMNWRGNKAPPRPEVECRMIWEMLVRYIGHLDDNIVRQRRELRNPFLWLQEGIRFVLTLPLRVLAMVGLVSDHTAERAQQSLIARVVALLFTVVTAFEVLMSLTLNWSPFLTQANKWFSGSP